MREDMTLTLLLLLASCVFGHLPLQQRERSTKESSLLSNKEPSLLSNKEPSRLSPEVKQLTDDYWNWRLSDAPEFATIVGISDYDNRLDDMSLAAYQNRYDQSLVFLTKAEQLQAGLTDHDDLLNIRILKEEVKTYIDGFQYNGFLLPLNYLEGVQVDFENLISLMALNTTADYEKLLSRYAALPTQLDQITTLLKEGVNLGIVNHDISMKGVSDALGRFVTVNPEESPLYVYFATLPGSFTPEEILDFQTRAKAIIQDQVNPAFRLLQVYVSRSYKTRPDIGISTLPNGVAMYKQLLKFHTSTNLTIAQIHQLGLDEVARIEGEMGKIIAELGFDMTVASFSDMIKNDPRFFYNNPEDMMAGFRDIVYNRIEPKLPDIFLNIPAAELILQENPSPDGTHAYYMTGSLDGSRPGVFSVNTYHYDTQPKYEMLTLSLHEGNPGHHFQGSHSIESPNFPYFRKTTEGRNYGMSPSRFPMYTGFVEGWGLYAESLGFDMNLFGDQYERYGHYSDEVWRACRLVVDTGMHALQWTRQEAINYIYAHTALTLTIIENEVDRYITWPGQADAYKVGQLTIQNLRHKAEMMLAATFDLKKFHEIVLESAGPLYIVEEEVDAWIASVKIH